MKKLIIGLICGLALGGTAVWFYGPRRSAPEAKEEKKEENKEVSFVQHATNGETFLKLDKETQERMGLKTAPLRAARLKPQVQGYGRVLDPAPLAAPKNDIYVGLLVLAFLAQITGFTFLVIDWASYPPSKPVIPASFKPPQQAAP